LEPSNQETIGVERIEKMQDPLLCSWECINYSYFNNCCSNLIKFWYIDGTHGLDIDWAAKWVILFLMANIMVPDHGSEYCTTAILLSFSRGSGSLAIAVAIAVLSILIL
jgi:hypothetical protein